MAGSIIIATSESEQLELRSISSLQHEVWVNKAWADIKAAPLISLGYGLVCAIAIMALLYWVSQHTQFIMSVISGFFFISPFLVIGIYDISRQLQRGEKPSLLHIIHSWDTRLNSVMQLIVIPVIIMAIWARMTMVFVALFFAKDVVMEDDKLLHMLMASDHAAMFFIFYFSIVACITAFIYAITLISLPICFDRNVDCVTAAVCSFRIVMNNLPLMSKWAGIVLLYSGFGFATMGLGFIITIPLLGHATWHAYQDLVG